MKKIKSLKLSNIIYRCISSILIFNIINLITNEHNYDISFMQHLNIFYILMPIIVVFTTLSIIGLYIKQKHFDYLITIISLFICSILWLNDDNIFFLIIIFLLFLLLYHFKPQDLDINLKLPKKIYITIIIISGIFMFYHIASIGILRYKLFTSPNFDLGIPGQNFYYLKKIGIPYSTCERDMLVNHLLIHFSLIYYLILPIYYLFSHIITLQVISALLISSSIIPIYLLCKKYKLTQMTTIIICLIFCTYAGAICSTYYDFHENIFLTPLLLWLFYFYEKNNTIGIFLFSILVLLVKEDAPIYIIIFSVFMLFDKKTRYGVPLLIFSVLYFIIVTKFLKVYGTGIMINRYDNLLYDNNNMLGIIKTLLINPGYFLKQLITSPENNINKIKYILELLLPLGFIPLYQKEKRNYLLLIPMLLTIITTYEYSYNINFHYSCGIIAFLFYLFIKNIKDLNIKNYLFICLITGILTYRTYAFPYLYNKLNDYQTNKSELIKVEKLLKEIPQSASVNAETFILPHLVNRDIIYEVYYHNDLPDIDYVILDTRYNDYIEHYENYINNGYVKDKELENRIIILKK